MNVTAEMVKALRDETGAQMMACKEALKENDGNVEKAKITLRKMGIDASEHRAERDTSAGIIYTYNHDNRVGVMVELRCETDFVAKNEEFQNLAKLIAMHIAWAKPLALNKWGLPTELLARETEIAQSQIPEKFCTEDKREMAQKILDGKLAKVWERVCLLNQKEVQVSDGKMTIEEMVKALSGKLTENIEIKRFVRYEVGE
jgi:elongation factor Ts